MITSLSTRGYLCPASVVQLLVGPGPTIVGQEVLVPKIGGSAITGVAAGPGIAGSISPGPTIAGASTPGTTGLEPPSISGSDKPKIG